MSKLQLKIPADTWIGATWDEYLETLENPLYEKAKSYYYQQQLRIEMAAVGANHADNNTIILLLVNLWGIGRSLPLKGFTNCSYRQQEIKEAQPDVSYYIGDGVKYAPTGNKVVNLDNNQPPDLAIEIAVSSLMDDLGPKRMLYEDLGGEQVTFAYLFSHTHTHTHTHTQKKTLFLSKSKSKSKSMKLSREKNYKTDLLPFRSG